MSEGEREREGGRRDGDSLQLNRILLLEPGIEQATVP